jgi:phosphoribosyl 1,2-cyclic phosphodiesterase
VTRLVARAVEGALPVLELTFYGVRGSTPCSCDRTRRYGGNTSCVGVSVPGEDPLIFDLGTGSRYLGQDLVERGATRATALVSHLHWDHVQGLPFFPFLLVPGNHLTIVGPPQGEVSLEDAVRRAVSPPVFPVELEALPGTIEFVEIGDGTLEVGGATVTVAPCPHVGPTNAYRIDAGSGSVAYISDHQQPVDGSLEVDPGIVELCRGVDVLIHDAQYSPEEFVQKATWGHCMVDFAVEVARLAGARRLVLYHHDPTHDDHTLDQFHQRGVELAAGAVEVLTAREGLVICSGGPA